MTKEKTIAEVAADYIREFDPALAAMFMDRPFHRVSIAKAFDKGLKSTGGHDYEMGKTIIALAELDRDERQDQYRKEMK